MRGAFGPVVFEPILKPKVWGGTRLARYGKRLEPGRNYGESWEIADLASTAPGGGGGEPARSVVSAGPLAGYSITQLVRRRTEELLGEAEPFEADDGLAFPLLIKLLDAAQHLSVQVHPSPAYARLHPRAHLKTESWVVVEAETAELPSGEQVEPTIFHGIHPGVSAPEFRAAAEDGTVARHLVRMPAEIGACHTLPSGTCHALGAGVLVAEVQTPSDTTFRVYDWAKEYGRAGRELHLNRALRCMNFEAPVRAEPATLCTGDHRGLVSRTDHYLIERLVLGPEQRANVAGPMETPAFAVVMVTRGSVVVGAGGLERQLGTGVTALVAASEVQGAWIAARTGGADVLVVWGR